MTSPFPGMDPYIEACHLWEDFHQRLVSEIQNQIGLLLPKRYVVRGGERTYMALTAMNGVDDIPTQADDAVAGKQGGPASGGQAASTGLLEAPGGKPRRSQ